MGQTCHFVLSIDDGVTLEATTSYFNVLGVTCMSSLTFYTQSEVSSSMLLWWHSVRSSVKNVLYPAESQTQDLWSTTQYVISWATAASLHHQVKI